MFLSSLSERRQPRPPATQGEEPIELSHRAAQEAWIDLRYDRKQTLSRRDQKREEMKAFNGLLIAALLFLVLGERSAATWFAGTWLAIYVIDTLATIRIQHRAKREREEKELEKLRERQFAIELVSFFDRVLQEAKEGFVEAKELQRLAQTGEVLEKDGECLRMGHHATHDARSDGGSSARSRSPWGSVADFA